MRTFASQEVEEAFLAFPDDIRSKLLELRNLIFETAATIDGVGNIEETLKWGEPAYVTSQTKSGTTIRFGRKRSNSSQYMILFHCQTNLIERFRALYGDALKFDGRRAILFSTVDTLPLDKLVVCISAALTYHLAH